MEVALIENLQREDLDAIEKARAFRDMMESLGYTQERLAKRVGVSRASVATTSGCSVPSPFRTPWRARARPCQGPRLAQG